MRDVLETVLELGGLLLLVLAAALWVGTALAAPAGIAVGGAGLLGVSALSGAADRSRRRKR